MFDRLTHQPHDMSSSISSRNEISMPQNVSSAAIEIVILRVTCNKELINGPRLEKTCLRGFANKKGADQPAHPRSLISAFVIRFLKSIISKLATSEISAF